MDVAVVHCAEGWRGGSSLKKGLPVSTPDLSSYSEDVLRTSPDYVAYVPRGGRRMTGRTSISWWFGRGAGVPGGVDDGDVRGQSGPAGGVCAERRRRGDVERAARGGRAIGRRRADCLVGVPGAGAGSAAGVRVYTKNIGVVDVREDTTGLLAFKYSDDEGETWSEQLSLPMERSAISPTDPGTPENWICYQTPILNPRGEVVCGFTRWASTEYHVEPHLFQRHSECWFLRSRTS